MSHHNDLHRPFEEVLHVGPTLNSGANEENRYRYMSNLHHPVFSTLQQPFYSAFKSPGMVGEKMSMDMLGYPFTGAQWKELERQALIYKYIMASVPVPAHLLSPFIRHLSATDSASHLTSQNKDPEIGRCKRTDGKKWRCSKEVAPHQKYCDRHMNRGRPRSRKHVENNTTTTKKIKKTVETNVSSSSLPNVLGSTNPPNESQFLVDTKNFEGQISAASYKEPNRGFEWTMDTTEQQFQHLIGASNECSVYNTTPSIFHEYYKELSLNISSYPNFINSNDILENGEFNFFPNPELLLFQNQPQTEDFFEAFPNSNNINHHLKTLSPSSLTLSMSMGKDNEENDDGLGLDSLMRWVPGGPLGEVLRPMSPATTISSPSGVLQRTMISMSDSSVCNSPNVGASTATQPEIVGTTEQHIF